MDSTVQSQSSPFNRPVRLTDPPELRDWNALAKRFLDHDATGNTAGVGTHVSDEFYLRLHTGPARRQIWRMVLGTVLADFAARSEGGGLQLAIHWVDLLRPRADETPFDEILATIHTYEMWFVKFCNLIVEGWIERNETERTAVEIANARAIATYERAEAKRREAER